MSWEHSWNTVIMMHTRDHEQHYTQTPPTDDHQSQETRTRQILTPYNGDFRSASVPVF